MYFRLAQGKDALLALKLAVKSFDKDIIRLACFGSFKTAKVRVNSKQNQHVPRESVYDPELCRILRNWLSVVNFKSHWPVAPYSFRTFSYSRY